MSEEGNPNSISQEPVSILFNPNSVAKKDVWEIDLIEILNLLIRILEKAEKKDRHRAARQPLERPKSYRRTQGKKLQVRQA